MSKAILGKKLGMTQVFTAEGQLVPVTVVETFNKTCKRSVRQSWRSSS